MKYGHVLGWLLVVVTRLEARMMDMSHIVCKHAEFNLTIKLNGTFGSAIPWFKVYNVQLSEHTGTHMDAPIHSNPRGRALHEIPKEQLVGPAVVFDVQEQAKTNPDYALTVADIKDFESAYGRIPDGAIAFLNTGGSDLYHDPERYYGTEKTWDFFSFHNPGFSAEAANWLIKERKIKGLGNDRLSFDVGQPTFLPVHEIIGEHNIYGLENVANVHKIPARGATVVVLPMAVEGGTGFPTRIMAFWGDNHELFYSKSHRTEVNAILVAISLILTIYIHMK